MMNTFYCIHFFPTFTIFKYVLDLLKRTQKARVVVVSSLAHKMGGVNPKNLNRQVEKSSLYLYCNTKFANVIFAKELARRLKGSGKYIHCLKLYQLVVEFTYRNTMMFINVQKCMVE